MADRLKLAIIGDPHTAIPQGADDPLLEIDPGRKLHGLSVELLSRTIDEVSAEGVDAALVLGDMTRDSELFNHDVARTLMKRLDAPFYIVIGNHDMLRKRPEHLSYPEADRLDRDEVCDFYRDFGFPGGMNYYVVELPGDVALIVLDSNRTIKEMAETNEDVARQDDGLIGERQLAWLDNVLSQIHGRGHLPLVAMHHTVTDHSPAEQPGHALYKVFRYWQAHDSAEVRKVLARYEVPLVLSGHIHAQSINTQDHVTNLVTSASVSYPHAWRLLHFEREAVYVESRKLQSVPSCPDLQTRSYEWMAEGMGHLIEQKTAALPLLKDFTREVGSFVTQSGWWSRFSDGTLAGFKADMSGLPRKNALAGMVYGQVSKLMTEFGDWKSRRPDPNEFELPYAFRYREEGE